MKRYKFLLTCMAGMSTSIVVKKMLNFAFEEEMDIDIKVFTLAEAISESDGYDLCLVAPQVSYEMQKLSDHMKCKVMLIDKVDYGNVDGKTILQKAISFYEEDF
ncbi:hypothetical protein [Spiroplasma endosymbiont of Othius punctulatus]|uniref:hypothetical protein n=1 Tax=Spiroplasma endosymbiont of Othius punctulatus TaxID=3066289 RepID=UPI0030D47518